MKTVFVTGASRGIGKSIALELGKDYQVIVGFGNSKDKAEEVVEEIKKLGGESLAVQLNIADRNSVDEAFNLIEKTYKNVDILVNNAGITKDNLTIRMDNEEWKKVIDINLTSTFLLSKYVIKKMLKKKFGKIINITSVVGHTGNLGQANYSASKGGVSSMSKSLSLEYAKKNIMINCIAPGFIETSMTEKINEDYKTQLKSKIPLDRFGTPQDIANCTAFLCSDISNYITGETIHVNGGMYFS